MKRFQECNIIEKFWRYRWYVAIPFIWLWYSTFGKLKVYRDEYIEGKYVHTNKYDVQRGVNLWRLLVGDAEIKMNWTYTMEEVQEKMKKYLDK
jgi:hypothetical protein